MAQKVLGIIPARYESTRFPGKILADIAGKSLIQRTYENAKTFPFLDALYIATDSQKIIDHAKKFGAEALLTSADCPTGSDRLVDAINKNPHLQDYDVVLNIQGDEPCMEVRVAEKVVQVLHQNPEEVMATAVMPIGTEEVAQDPTVVKCVINNDFHALYFSRAMIPAGRNLTFVPSCTYYHHIGIYAFRTDFLFKYAKLPHTPLQLAEDLEQLKVLEHGYPIRVAIIDSESVGVDTPADIAKVERLLEKRGVA